MEKRSLNTTWGSRQSILDLDPEEAIAEALEGLINADAVVRVVAPNWVGQVELTRYDLPCYDFVAEKIAVPFQLLIYGLNAWKGIAVHEAAHINRGQAEGQAILRINYSGRTKSGIFRSKGNLLADGLFFDCYGASSDFVDEQNMLRQTPGFRDYLDAAHQELLWPLVQGPPPRKLKSYSEGGEHPLSEAIRIFRARLQGIEARATELGLAWGDELFELWLKNPAPLKFAKLAVKQFWQRLEKLEGTNLPQPDLDSPPASTLETAAGRGMANLTKGFGADAEGMEKHRTEVYSELYGKIEALNLAGEMIKDKGPAERDPGAKLAVDPEGQKGVGTGHQVYPTVRGPIEVVDRLWREIVAAFNFLRQPETILEGGKKSGRYYGRTAAKVAGGKEDPFAQQIRLSSKELVLDLFFDTSGSMDSAAREAAYVFLASLNRGTSQGLLPNLKIRAFAFDDSSSDPELLAGPGSEDKLFSRGGGTSISRSLQEIKQTSSRAVVIYSDLQFTGNELEALPLLLNYFKMKRDLTMVCLNPDLNTVIQWQNKGFDMIEHVTSANLLTVLKNLGRMLFREMKLSELRGTE